MVKLWPSCASLNNNWFADKTIKTQKIRVLSSSFLGNWLTSSERAPYYINGSFHREHVKLKSSRHMQVRKNIKIKETKSNFLSLFRTLFNS